MSEWQSEEHGGSRIEYEEKYAAVSRFFGGSGEGHVDGATVSEFESLYAADNNYTKFSRFIDWLKIGEKYCRLIFPLFAFAVGEILLFVLFYVNDSVLGLNSLFFPIREFSIYVVTLLNGGSIALSIFASRKLFEKDQILEGWMTAGITSLCVIIFPGVAGWVCILPVAAVFLYERDERRNYIYLSVVTVLTLFGIAALWGRYYTFRHAVLFDELLSLFGVENVTMLPVLIFATGSGLLAYLLMLKLKGSLFSCKQWLKYVFVAVYGVLAIAAPAVTFILAFIYAFVLLGRFAGAEDESAKRTSAFAYVVFAALSTLLLLADIHPLVPVVLAVIELVVLMILYRRNGPMHVDGMRFSVFTGFAFFLLAAAVMAHIFFNWEVFLPALRSDAAAGEPTGALSVPQIFLLSCFAVILVFAIILTAKGGKTFAGVMNPVFTVAGFALSLFLMELLFALIPGFAEGLLGYSLGFVILIGAAFAVPCVLFQLVTKLIVKKLR